MYTDFEDILAVLRARTGVGIPNLSYVFTLSRGDYLAVLEVLFEVLQSGVNVALVFGVRMSFNSKWAAAYYREAFSWWLGAVDATERLNYECMLAQTYRKAQASWTWERMLELAPEEWPSSVAPLLWRHLSRDERTVLLAGVHRILDGGGADVFALMNVLKVDDAGLLQRVDGMPGLPRLVRKKVDGRLGRRLFAGLPRVREANLAGFSHCWSVEVDDERMEATVREGLARLGWGLVVEGTLAGGDVPAKGWVRIWCEAVEEEIRWVVARREDDTVVAAGAVFVVGKEQ